MTKPMDLDRAVELVERGPAFAERCEQFCGGRQYRLSTELYCAALMIVKQAHERIDAQVDEFHRVMGFVDRTSPGAPDDATVRLRARLITEEYFELMRAMFSDDEDWHELHGMEMAVKDFYDRATPKPDVVEVADACADLDYVVAGTRLAFGIDGQAVANEVHRSNMAKAPGGIVSRDAYGKVIKPKDWTPPDIAGVLGIEPSKNSL
jgi:predicted HAD superfamily Cof-like phosphohydrolase